MGTGRGTLFGLLRRTAAGLAGAAETRLALLGADLEQESLRALQVAANAVMAVFFLCLACAVAALWVIVYFWDDHRLAATGAVGGVALVCAGLLAWRARRAALARPAPFAATIEQLRRDRERLA